MTIVERTMEFGQWVIRVDAGVQDIISLFFNHDPSDNEIQIAVEIFLENHEYDDIPQLDTSMVFHVETIRNFVIFIKEHPTIGLTGYNTYLSSLTWTEQAEIRFFVYLLANGLAAYYEVIIDDWSEGQVLLQIRNWIVATPGKKIAKIVFGNIRVLT